MIGWCPQSEEDPTHVDRRKEVLEVEIKDELLTDMKFGISLDTALGHETRCTRRGSINLTEKSSDPSLNVRQRPIRSENFAKTSISLRLFAPMIQK